MEGHPLALTIGGGYIEATHCSLSAFLDIYQREASKLLEQRRELSLDYPLPVTIIQSLRFEQKSLITYDVLLAVSSDAVPIGGKLEVAIYLSMAGSTSSGYLLEVPSANSRKVIDNVV